MKSLSKSELHSRALEIAIELNATKEKLVAAQGLLSKWSECVESDQDGVTENDLVWNGLEEIHAALTGRIAVIHGPRIGEF